MADLCIIGQAIIFWLMLRTRPSCLHTDTTVVYTPQIHYRRDRRVHDRRVCAAHDRRKMPTQTKLLPLTSSNPNPNPNPHTNPNPNPNPKP